MLGSVIIPGELDYYEGMTISDAIFKAGGYAEGGIPYRIEVSRRIISDTTGLLPEQNVQIYTLNVSENLTLNEQEQQFKLKPFDIVVIRKSPRYESQKTVAILGEVNFPGTYSILSNFERITDIFPRAGGLKKEAYLKGARFYRDGELVAVDLNAIIVKPSLPANLLLKFGDSLYVPRVAETIRIEGSIQNPSLVNYDPNFQFGDYISQAGGFLENALKKRTYVTSPNGRTFRTKKFLFINIYPKVEPGATITVPVKTERPERVTTTGEKIAILSLISTLALTVIRLF